MIVVAGTLALAAWMLPCAWRLLDDRLSVTAYYVSQHPWLSPRDRADMLSLLGPRIAFTGNMRGLLVVRRDPWGRGWRLDPRSGLDYSVGRDGVDDHGAGDDVVAYPRRSTAYLAYQALTPALLAASLWVLLTHFALLLFLSPAGRLFALGCSSMAMGTLIGSCWPVGFLREFEHFLLLPISATGALGGTLASLLVMFALESTSVGPGKERDVVAHFMCASRLRGGDGGAPAATPGGKRIVASAAR